MSFHVPNQYRLRPGQAPSARSRHLESTDAVGNCGMFIIPPSPAARRPLPLTVMASDATGWDELGYPPPAWEHVSVSTPVRCPTWEEMCFVKGIFWDQEDAVIQLHPPRSEWINDHPYCLHLWRPIGIELPRPPSLAVGTGDPRDYR